MNHECEKKIAPVVREDPLDPEVADTQLLHHPVHGRQDLRRGVWGG